MDRTTKPAYSLSSVDNCLRLLQMLRDAGEVRLKDVAATLEIGPSTAHRLLQMLVYRGFAVQDDSRRYLAGPGLGVQVPERSGHARLRRIAEPYLELLSQQTGETAHLMVRVGTTVRFLCTAESSGTVKIGDRRGAVLPALSTSGGKMLLAHASDADLARLYRSSAAETAGTWLPTEDFEAIVATLHRLRDLGIATNHEESEDGVCAAGIAVLDDDRAVAAVSLTVPMQREAVLRERSTRAALRAVARDIGGELSQGADAP